MIIIPGQLMSLIIFPGVILHEIAHKFFCDLFNIPVYEVCYLKFFSSKAGYVYHDGTRNFTHHLLIGIGPLIINSFICMLLLIPFSYSAYLGTSSLLPSSLSYNILWWLGYSIGLGAWPSNQDVHGLDERAESEFTKMIAFFIQSIIGLGNLPFLGFWIQLGYVRFISGLLPMLFLH